MNLIKELLVLREEDEDPPALKVPSFGEMQKAIYKVALPYFIKAQSSKDLGDLSLAVLQDEAENDRFWTTSFDDAHSSLEKFADGRKDIEDAIDAVGEAFDEVVSRIHDHYSDNWNHAPGTKLPKLKEPDEVDGTIIVNLIYDMIPGAKEQEEAQRYHAGVVDSMHKDFTKLANQQRMSKDTKSAVQPILDAADRVVYELQKGGGYATSLHASDEALEVTVSTTSWKAEDDAKLIDPKSVHVPDIFSKVDTDYEFGKSANENYLTYFFDWKEVPSSAIRDLLNRDMLEKMRRTR